MQIYMIGIGGTAMGNLAVLLKENGHQVIGSDESVYPPMSDFLKQNHIEVAPGYKNQIPHKTDLVIIGNAISRGNDQAEQVLREKIPFMSMPEAIGKFILERTKNVVVSGTHGKTTTTSMLVSILRAAGLDPGFLIGGIAAELGTGGHIGKDPVFVIEGDEYDSAFFDKRSKFVHYSPDILIINNIEFDHSDIFANLTAVENSFKQVINIVPDNGIIMANGDDENVRKLTASTQCPVRYYGSEEKADTNFTVIDDAPPLKLTLNNKNYEVNSVWGIHNAYNAVASIVAAVELGISESDIQKGLENFKGVERRMQLIGKWQSGVKFFLDFAHHPTAIKSTLSAFKKAFPGNRIVAIVEPRSNTMVRNYLQNELIDAMQIGDMIYLADLHRKEKIPLEQRLDRDKILGILAERGREVSYAVDGNSIFSELENKSQPEDIVVIMSNGSFGGLIHRIEENIQASKR